MVEDECANRTCWNRVMSDRVFVRIKNCPLGRPTGPERPTLAQSIQNNISAVTANPKWYSAAVSGA